LLDIYRESFRNGEGTERFLDHVLVIAIDAGGFHRCKAVHPHCYHLEVTKPTNLSSANRYMTKEFLELVWLKLSFQQRILELGYNFLFTARCKFFSKFKLAMNISCLICIGLPRW